MPWPARRPSATVDLPEEMEDADAASAGVLCTAADEILSAAERFLAIFFGENPGAGVLSDRIRQVSAEVEEHGTYRHTPAELAFAARVAWRNSSRCIGRLYWRSLRVRDRREISAPGKIADECFRHLREATNAGRIRPTITVFAPEAPGRPGPRILNSQLVGYAGHLSDDAVTGDPSH